MPAPLVLERLRATTTSSRPAARRAGDRLATTALPGARGTIGFIAGVSDHFCADCNRLRLTADGRLKTCLFGGGELDVRPLLERPPELAAAIRAAIAGKRFDKRAERAAPTAARCTRSADERCCGGRMRHGDCIETRRQAIPAAHSHRPELSHIDARGRARMVDVGAKAESERRARAEALVVMAPATLGGDPRRGRPQGRRAGRRAPRRHHGRQAHARAHPAVPPAGADPRRRSTSSPTTTLPGLRITAEMRPASAGPASRWRR